MENKANASIEVTRVLTGSKHQLLSTYQSNSPIYSSEELIKRHLHEQYADALIKFAIGLQEMFCKDKLFNKTAKSSVAQQRLKIKEFYHECFSSYPKEERNVMIYDLIIDLIGGRNSEWNFAYGLKLYFLFKEELGLTPFCKELFESRIRCNILSKYYTNNTQKHIIENEEIVDIIDRPLAKKLCRYKVFNKEN